MNDPLTAEELQKVREDILRRKTIKLYLCYETFHPHPHGVFHSIFKIDGAFIDNDPRPYIDWKSLLDHKEFKWFTNYWHAYAYKLKLEDR